MVSKSYLRNGIIIGISALALFFSLFKLTESPSFWYDEGWYFQAAQNMATVGIDGLQLAPQTIEHLAVTTVGYPVIYTLALWFKVFGISVMSARTLMVICIGLLLVLSFFLSKRLFGKMCALLGLSLLATFPPLYGNGKSVLGEVPGLVFLFASLVSLYQARVENNRKLFWLILSGISLGLCVATKPLFLVMLPAFGIACIVEYRRGFLTVKDILFGFVCTLVPIGIWLLVQFQVQDSATGILSYYANPYQETDILGTMIRNAKGMLHDVSTLYTLALIVCWSIGLGVRKYLKEQISGEEIASYIFSLLVIVAFLRTAGWYRYLFPAQVMSLIFFPYSFIVMCRFVLGKCDLATWLKPVVGVITGLLAVAGIYQVGFHSWVAEGYTSHKTEYWQNYFKSVPSTTSVFFYNTPEVVPFIQGRNYYQYLEPAGGPIGIENLIHIQNKKVDLIILESDTYQSLRGSFGGYILETTTYKYSILRKIEARRVKNTR